MQFFLEQIVARIVGAWVVVDCARMLRGAFRDGKIRGHNADFLNWWRWVADRQSEPVSFWIQVSLQIVFLLSGATIAIFGWLRP